MCKSYPNCIGGLDPEDEWCNNECPEQILRECTRRMIICIAPSNHQIIALQLRQKEELKIWASSCCVGGKKQ